jgi:hypothetical protein
VHGDCYGGGLVTIGDSLGDMVEFNHAQRMTVDVAALRTGAGRAIATDGS